MNPVGRQTAALVRALSITLSLIGFGIGGAAAQTPGRGGGIVPTALGTFEITPDGAPLTVNASSTNNQAEFLARNATSSAGTWTFTCASSTVTKCISVSPSSATIAAGASREVIVTFNGLAAGTGRITLSTPTSGGESGYYNVTVAGVAVAVTPDGGTAPPRLTASGPYTEQFTVKNTGNVTTTYAIACAGSSNLTCSGVTASSVLLVAGATTQVGASYSVGAVGTGTLTLTATSGTKSDAGSYTVSVVTPSPQAAQIAVGPVNAGTMIERSLCLTVRLSEAAASECGDLRVVHALPTIRTLGKLRAPTLLYNSGSGHPYPWVAAIVTLPLISTVPDSVTGTLSIGGTILASGKWTGSEWAPGKARRTVLNFDGLSKATGIYAYTLEMRTWFGTTSKPTTATGSLAIVNRSASPFGPGWWLAGLEALDVATKVWVGGDGSVRQYLPVAGRTDAWTASAVDHPDTLKQIGTQYVRYDQDSVQVTFDNTGKHLSTTNRQKHVTTFAYASGLLDRITLPPSGSGKTYQFYYTASKLDSVTAPRRVASEPRTAVMTKVSGELKSIRDPDGSTVQFNYSASAGFQHIMVARSDRLGVFTSFDWGPGKKVAQSRVLSGSIIIALNALESRGLGTSVDTALAYTRLDGARAVVVGDTTLFWLDALGAVRKIVDAKGNTTLLARADTRWPGLVTRVQRANGQVLGAVYDSRGRLLSVTDSSTVSGTTYATTNYLWDTKWDEVTKITQPEGDNVTMFYDVATGNRLWQQDGRGSGTRTNFTYNAASQLQTIARPGTPLERIDYDGLGNVSMVTTPKGYQTLHLKDALGRDTLISARIDTVSTSTRRHTQRIVYDKADRDTLTVSAGPVMGAGTTVESLFVRKAFNIGGRLDSLSRWSIPNAANLDVLTTRWVYDGIGRPVKEFAPDAQVDSTEYDQAGNIISLIPRRGLALKIRMTYDGTNRLLQRTVPAVAYQALPSGIDGSRIGRPNQTYAAYTVPGDVQDFGYDQVGNLIKADNAHARVRRTYFKNDLVATDSLYIRTASGSSFTQHMYRTGYEYDLNGRRKLLDFPSQFTPPRRVVGLTYTYDPGFGGLTAVTDPQANRYDITYTLLGELRTVTLPGQYRQEFTYDADGRLTADTIVNVGGTAGVRVPYSPVRATAFAYDARASLLRSADPMAYQDAMTASYSGLGYLVGSTFSQIGKYNGVSGAVYQVGETFKYDGLGNRTYSDSRTTLNSQSIGESKFIDRTAAYYPAPGRLKNETSAAGVNSYTYDMDGNVEFVQQPADPLLGTPIDERRSYYAADGKLTRVVSRSAADAIPLLRWYRENVEVYRYDALGRRVWLKSDKDCQENTLPSDVALECQTSRLRRTVWDQNQELGEIQMPGDSTSADLPYWENDTSVVLLPSIMAGGHTQDKNPFYGRVLYTHGPGLDRPLAAYRMGYSFAVDSLGNPLPAEFFGLFTITPFWNQRGDAVLGAYETGNRINCRSVVTANGTKIACVRIHWPDVWSAYDQDRGLVRTGWHGSLLESRRDGTGLQYKRNRFYDPASGQFTQEDPVGLAGGLNLYGFAKGDPVNYSDPFGLWPCGPLNPICYRVGAFLLGRLFPAMSRFGAASTGLTVGSIRNVNPGFPGAVGRLQNCVNCAIAADATLAGRPASALPGGAEPLSVLEKLYRSTFKPTSGVQEIEKIMGEAGSGARGIVAGLRGAGQDGHVFNVVNQGGTIRFLDGQTGTAAVTEGYRQLMLLRTNP